MEFIYLAIGIICIILLLIVIFMLSKSKKIDSLDQNDKKDIIDSNERIRSSVAETLKGQIDTINNTLKNYEDSQRMGFESVRNTLDGNLKQLNEDNKAHLDLINETVNDKLSKNLDEKFKASFETLRNNLNDVSKSLNEMRNLSDDVGSLKKVLTNVKTTGVLGEYQLGAIIDQMLTPQQYYKNKVTKRGSRDNVEFAIRFPGNGDDEVLMPIDSKFSYIVYNEMIQAYEENRFDDVKEKQKQLANTIKQNAKDISSKYIDPPYTTNFAIMFLPLEGLYAEVAKLGLIETIQKDFNITIAGPTTLAALLNSFQMGFQTLNIQKKSNEVWNILSQVKKEFENYSDLCKDIQNKFDKLSLDFNKLVSTRTNAINKKLKDVQDTPALESTSNSLDDN